MAALELRKKGYTYAQIALELNCHEETVYQAVKRAMQRLIAERDELAGEVRRLEIERYDAFLLKLQPAIEVGDVKAIATALRISECRRKLLGLDVPTKQVVEVTGNTEQDNALKQILERLKNEEGN